MRTNLSYLRVVALGALLAACNATGTASPSPETATASPTTSATSSPTPLATGGCPPTLTTAAEMVQLGTAKAASCFGQTVLTIEGYTLDCGGCGGVDEYDRAPSWLATFIPLYFMGPIAGTAGIDPASGFAVFMDPTLGLAFPPPGTLVRTTGHFNDPIALTCQVTPKPGSSAPPLDPNDVIATCQRSFVVTAVTVITP